MTSRGGAFSFNPVKDRGLSIVHPENKVETLNCRTLWRQMAARLCNADDAEARQTLIVKKIEKKSPQN